MPKSVRHPTAKERYDNTVTSRTLIVFAFTFLSVFLLMQAYRIFDQMVGGRALIDALWVLTAVFGGLFVLCVIWSAFSFVRKSKRFGGLTLPLNLVLLFALITASCVIMAVFHLDGVMFLYAALPAAALLYLIRFIYQREFFFLALFGAGGALVLWILHCWQNTHPFRALCLGIAAMVGFLLLTGLAELLRRNGGALPVREKHFQVFPGSALYRPLLLSLPLYAVFSLVFGIFPQFAFVAMLVLCAYLFLMAVYFTVKMM